MSTKINVSRIVKALSLLTMFLFLLTACSTTETVYNKGPVQSRKYTKGLFLNFVFGTKLQGNTFVSSFNNPSERVNLLERKFETPSLEYNKPEEVVTLRTVDFSNVSSLVNIQNENINMVQNDSCDELILKNGDIVYGKVVEIGVDEIKYKKCDYIEGPTYSIKKADVFMIKYVNGSKDVFNESQTFSETNNHVSNSDLDVTSLLSLIIGGVGLPLAFFVSSLFVLFSVTGIILGLIGLNKIKKSKGKLKGQSMAILGVLFGTIGLFIVIAFLALVL